MSKAHSGLSSEATEKARLELNENPDTLHHDIQQTTICRDHMRQLVFRKPVYSSSAVRYDRFVFARPDIWFLMGLVLRSLIFGLSSYGFFRAMKVQPIQNPSTVGVSTSLFRQQHFAQSSYQLQGNRLLSCTSSTAFRYLSAPPAHLHSFTGTLLSSAHFHAVPSFKVCLLLLQIFTLQVRSGCLHLIFHQLQVIVLHRTSSTRHSKYVCSSPAHSSYQLQGTSAPPCTSSYSFKVRLLLLHIFHSSSTSTSCTSPQLHSTSAFLCIRIFQVRLLLHILPSASMVVCVLLRLSPAHFNVRLLHNLSRTSFKVRLLSCHLHISRYGCSSAKHLHQLKVRRSLHSSQLQGTLLLLAPILPQLSKVSLLLHTASRYVCSPAHLPAFKHIFTAFKVRLLLLHIFHSLFSTFTLLRIFQQLKVRAPLLTSSTASNVLLLLHLCKGTIYNLHIFTASRYVYSSCQFFPRFKVSLHIIWTIFNTPQLQGTSAPPATSSTASSASSLHQLQVRLLLLTSSTASSYVPAPAPVFCTCLCPSFLSGVKLKHVSVSQGTTRDKRALMDGFPDTRSWTILRAILLSLEVLIENPELQVNGFILIIDWSNFSFKQASKLTPNDSFPARFGGIHFVNQPWYIQAMYTIIKPFLKDKTRKRIYLHGNNLTSLQQLIGVECLPSEFGGSLPPYDVGLWARTLLGPDYSDESEYTLTYDALHVINRYNTHLRCSTLMKTHLRRSTPDKHSPTTLYT
ncbi:hypothetical protein WMY93_012630 [Mugilogobius chulae]|uniref:CRAL-TRIO domain-containing protein n=1 Tax=Mugilogobius chulae TaxID=88201 RepID=A0AAW0P3T1_9GOBI